jgi:hypothetical protein
VAWTSEALSNGRKNGPMPGKHARPTYRPRHAILPFTEQQEQSWSMGFVQTTLAEPVIARSEATRQSMRRFGFPERDGTIPKAVWIATGLRPSQ